MGRWLLALGLLTGCGAELDVGSSAPAGTARLAGPCIVEDEGSGPASSPMGLAQPGKQETFAVWPAGRIPYELDASLGPGSKSSTLAAMNDWQTKSQNVVRFDPAKPNESPRLIVVAGPDPIANHVGYRAGSNSKITLPQSSSVALARHELGHVLGLNHEHRHPERAKHTLVKMENVKKTDFCLDQFSACQSCLPVLEYNPGSVMHYETDDLASCHPNGPALLHLDGTPIKLSWALTPGDIAAIFVLYGAPPTGAGGASGSGGAAGAGGGAAGAASSAGGASAGGASAGAAGASGGGATSGPATGSGGAAAGSAGTSPPDVEDPAGEGAANEGSIDEGASCSAGPSRASRAAWPWLVFGGLALCALGRARQRRTEAHLP